jgi:Mrp family chromosome partitioning ATPase
MVAISVAEKAIPSSVPKQGRFGKKQLIFMGFFGGIAAGIILAFLLEQMAPGMTTPGNAERRLNLPVIAAIRRLILSPQLPIDENPKVDEAAAEMDMEQEMIALYQTITAVLPDSNRCSVLFVGSRSNEGTSTVARQLARVASLRMGKSVLLIDLDRSRPDLHVYSNLKPEGDSLNSLETGDQIEQSLRRVEESSLYVMPLFWKTITAPKTIDYAKRGSFWESLRERFDLIIVDSAPATMFPDGPAIVSRVDGVIFVVEAEKTRWQVAQSVKEKIINSGGNIIGVVFNKRRFYIPEFIYRYL